MRSLRWAAMLAMLVASGTSVPSARALHPQRFSLNWVRDADAAECIASHRLASLIEGMLGPVFAAPGNAELAIEGRVFRAERWRARIAITDRSGELQGVRELESDDPSCRTLDAQIVLVVAMAIDPEVADAGLPPELVAELGVHGDVAEQLLAELRTDERQKRAPAAAQAQVAPRAPPTSPRPRQPAAAASRELSPLHDFSAALLADFGFGLGMLPALGSAAGIGFGLQPLSSWTFAVSVQWWFDNEVPIETANRTDASVSFQLVQPSLVACIAVVNAPALRWSGCLGGTAAVRWTDSEGLLDMQNDARVDFGPSLATELWFAPIGPFAPRFGAVLHLPLYRDRYAYRESLSGTARPLFQPEAIEAWAYIGAALLL